MNVLIPLSTPYQKFFVVHSHSLPIHGAIVVWKIYLKLYGVKKWFFFRLSDRFELKGTEVKWAQSWYCHALWKFSNRLNKWNGWNRQTGFRKIWEEFSYAAYCELLSWTKCPVPAKPHQIVITQTHRATCSLTIGVVVPVSAMHDLHFCNRQSIHPLVLLPHRLRNLLSHRDPPDTLAGKTK